ncbi:cyclodextrin-binding protein [Heyndrickxia shackletonii]|uniref:Maltodextrin-binding protein n=1 Tax=Heyndrickxia shackletonii TaxID=157838 RepID=A0A0Q3WT77_9BACI|nr:extracellular solute-binding protein [Heyndrickxia shackletonii]KQL50747.1 cyclodextrin-binding protein [Heyndrickxia shackletonii]NEY99701.1 extracellular solute-binding protein [Heyndrickxia shackletonii]
MKKFLALVFTLALMVGMLAACGPKDSSSGSASDGGKKAEDTKKPEKLLVWEDKKRGVALEPAIKSFEEKYGIKVEYKELGMADEMQKQLPLDGQAGTGPDVLTLPHDQLGALATQGLLAPIKVDQSVLDLYTESSIQAETYNGKLYGLPKATETPVFIYNKKYMKKAPETFDELYTFAKDFTKGGKYGFLALWDNFYFANAIMAGNGGYVFKNNGGTLDAKDIGLNNDGALTGAEYIGKWYKEGLFPKGIVGKSGGSAKDGLMNDGKVASEMDGPWAFQGLQNAKIDFGVAPLPKLPNGEYPKTFVGVKGWQVSAFSKNKEWATKLVEWLANPENAKIRYEKTGEIPPVKSLMEDSIIKDNEGANAVAVQSERGVPMPNIPEMGQVWEPMATSLQLIATNKQDAKKSLDDAVKTINEKIASTK